MLIRVLIRSAQCILTSALIGLRTPCRQIDALFDELDTDGSGCIDAADIIRHGIRGREKEDVSADEADERSSMLEQGGLARYK